MPKNTSEDSLPEKSVRKKTATGIGELDRVLHGGLTEGHVVLLSGASGTGKTIFSFKWLFEGVKNDENCIYITMTEPLFKAIANLETMDFYDREAVESEQLKIVDVRDMVYGSAKFRPDDLLEFIEQQIKETGATRLVIDSITAIAYNLEDRAKIRRFIFDLGTLLATLGCTTVLTSEVTGGGKYSVYGVEEFISDSIILLSHNDHNGNQDRSLEIVKVRGESYIEEELDYKITSDGIVAFPAMRNLLEYSASEERVSTGIDPLDNMMNGGLYRGSTTFVSGPTGAGKTLMSLGFLMEGLRNGEPGLFAGFEESREEIIRNARGFGWDLEKYEEEGLLTIRCAKASNDVPGQHLLDISNIVEEKGIERIAVDSLSALSDAMKEKRFNKFSRKLNGFLKKNNVTSIYTSSTRSLIGATQVTETGISTQADNIIILRFVEVEGALKHMLNIVKIRGSGHSKGLRSYTITSNGIVIGPSLSGYAGVMSGVTTKVSESVVEMLESEFERYIGPMGHAIFEDVKAGGFDQQEIEEKIMDMEEEGILEEADAEEFLKRVRSIIEGGGDASGKLGDKKLKRFFKERKD